MPPPSPPLPPLQLRIVVGARARIAAQPLPPRPRWLQRPLLPSCTSTAAAPRPPRGSHHWQQAVVVRHQSWVSGQWGESSLAAGGGRVTSELGEWPVGGMRAMCAEWAHAIRAGKGGGSEGNVCAEGGRGFGAGSVGVGGACALRGGCAGSELGRQSGLSTLCPGYGAGEGGSIGKGHGRNTPPFSSLLHTTHSPMQRNTTP